MLRHKCRGINAAAKPYPGRHRTLAHNIVNSRALRAIWARVFENIVKYVDTDQKDMIV
jgi:hypothetical protein